MTRRGRKGNQESESDSDSEGETFLRKGEMKERPNAICKTIDASTAVFDRYDEDCRWRGEEKRKAFAKAKAERASGASLILPNMGCTRQVFWRHLGGLYPVFSLFLTYCFSDLSVFLFNYILCFFLPLFIFYILQISSSSSVLDPLCHIGYQPRSCHLTKIKICFAYHYILATRSGDFCQVKICSRDDRCQTL